MTAKPTPQQTRDERYRDTRRAWHALDDRLLAAYTREDDETLARLWRALVRIERREQDKERWA